MLQIICGEDPVKSYNYYLQLKKTYQEKNYQIFQINFQQLTEIYLWLNDSVSLFNEKKIFIGENFNKKINKKNQKITNILSKIIKDKNLQLIIWEEGVNQRSLKYPPNAIIKELKPDENIFQLQDALYPGNFHIFLKLLTAVKETNDENFIFLMLVRQIRNLILIANKQYQETKLQKWQIFKLENQLKKWNYEKLISFYQSLFQIEIKTKTSTNPLSIIKLLEIITSYYL